MTGEMIAALVVLGVMLVGLGFAVVERSRTGWGGGRHRVPRLPQEIARDAERAELRAVGRAMDEFRGRR